MNDQELLIAMRKAYQDLLLGKSVKVMQKDGRRVDFEPANKQSLLNEINRLESNLGAGRRRPPAGVV